jgi:hypothetical protein
MDANRILHELATTDGLPVEAIQAAREQRAALAPMFVRLVERFVAGEENEGETEALFLVFHLLGEWREKSAYRPLAALLRLPPDDIEDALGDAIAETCHRVMAAVFDGNPGPLHDIIRDGEANEIIRSRMCEALAMLTLRGELAREQTAAFLRACFHEMAPQETCFVWEGWQHAISMLGLVELVPLVREAFDREFIDPVWMSFEEFEEDMARTVAGEPAPEWQLGDEFDLFGDTLEELSSWAFDEATDDTDDRETDDQEGGDADSLWRPRQPAVNPYKDVGRNDPCPCGSGKKFKKCCLDKIEAQQRETAAASRLPARAASRLPALEEPGDAFAFADDPSVPPLTAYDPLVEPDSGQWLALEEDERLRLVKDYHRRARIDLPQADLHAIVHVAVENQIAELDERTYRKLDALIEEGLDRHEAVHAIGSVLMMHLRYIMAELPVEAAAHDRYWAELAALTAASWRREFS